MDLASLLAPLGTDAFFERVYERQPLHLAAAVPRPPLFTHEALAHALADRSRGVAPPSSFTAFPEHLRRGGPATIVDLAHDPALFRAYLDEGHAVIWNRARGLDPAIDALCADIALATGAHVWPNVYSTGTGGKALDAHFDNHEVIAVHCEGRKNWRISTVRVDRPLDAAEMEPAIAAVLEGRRDEAVASPQLVFSVAPGDVVYVPRGQFHEASTPEGRSLHVTFGIRHLSGHDVLELLAELALTEPLFREYLPATAADPGGDRAAAQLAEVLARAAEILSGPDLTRAIAAARSHLVRRSAPRER